MAPQLDMFESGFTSPPLPTQPIEEGEAENEVDQAAHAFFALFKPELDKLRAQGIASGCGHYWRSRWHDWINHSNGNSKSVWEEKKEKERLWPTVWRLYRDELCQIYNPVLLDIADE